MSIDFSDMLDEDDDVVLHPRDIFFTLDRAPSFSFPPRHSNRGDESLV